MGLENLTRYAPTPPEPPPRTNRRPSFTQQQQQQLWQQLNLYHADSPPPNEVLSTHSPVVTLRGSNQVKTNGSIKNSCSRCQCCPYGFHIDTDFVRYCEDISSGSNTLKDQRRVRRRQRRSMEVLLGLVPSPTQPPASLLPVIADKEGPEDPPPENMPKKRSTSPRKDKRQGIPPLFSQPPPPPDLLHTSEMLTTSLQEAMVDFEETLERSVSMGGVASKPLPPPVTTSTPKREIPAIDLLTDTPSGQGADSPDYNEGLSNLGKTDGLGLPTAAQSLNLQAVRQQMAQSLEKLKELEEQVKIIPVLQVKVSVLQEEKRKLAQLLKKETETKLATPRSTHNASTTTVTPLSRSIGSTTCDLGRNTSSSTQTDPVPSNTAQDSTGMNFLRNMTQSSSVFNRWAQPLIPPPRLSRDTATNTEKSGVDSKLVGTDLRFDQIITPSNLEHAVKEAEERVRKACEAERKRAQFFMSSQGTQTTHTLRNTQSVQTDVIVSQVPISTVLKRDVGINVSEEHPIQLSKDTVATENVKTTKNAAVGAYSVKDVWCLKCQAVPTRNVACGEAKINELDCEKCTNKKTRSIGAGSCTVDEDFCKICTQGKITVCVGVGEADVRSALPCAKCEIRKKDAAVLAKAQTREASAGVVIETMAVGTSPSGDEALQVCDKCSGEIRQMAKEVVQYQPKSSNLPPLPSRIPRPSPPRTPAAQNKLNTSSNFNKVANQDTSFHNSDITTSEDVCTENKQTVDTQAIENAAQKREFVRQETVVLEKKEPESESSDEEEGSDEDSESVSSQSSEELNEERGFQPIQEQRKTAEPSAAMKAALKVFHDSLKVPGKSQKLTSALSIIQREWFQVSSTKTANALDVEDYLDALENVTHEVMCKVINMTDLNGNTALHYAVSHGNLDVVSLLLDSKVCDVSVANHAGYTAPMLLALAPIRSDTHRHVARRLFHMADVNTRAAQHGQTALMLAVSHGRSDTVRLLLEAGADMNIQDVDGSTALMCAAEHGHTDIVKCLLLQPDCDATLKDNDGSTALSIAMEAGHKDVGVLIYAHLNLGRNTSPYASLRHPRRSSSRASTPNSVHSLATPPASPLPYRSSNRLSSSSLPPIPLSPSSSSSTATSPTLTRKKK